MRKRRIKVIGQTAVYHCISRIVGGAFLLEADETKEVLANQIRKVAVFCGVEIITYCVMSNHIHVLVRVREQKMEELSDKELLKRCEQIYGDDEMAMLQWENRLHNPERREDTRRALIARMGDVSIYMKELKQRFSTWYNRTHDRYGTLWAERFKSVLVENVPGALSMVAAYIDLNPVRAGIVDDPKDYRFCGYSRWLATGNGCKEVGLYSIFCSGGFDSSQALIEYRKMLYGIGSIGKRSDSPRLNPEEVRKVLEDGGKLKISDLLRHRVRFFTDGAILGSSAFVKSTYHGYKEHFTDRKTDKCTLLPIDGNTDLASFRNLSN